MFTKLRFVVVVVVVVAKIKKTARLSGFFIVF
jgi:hypothetical protein